MFDSIEAKGKRTETNPIPNPTGTSGSQPTTSTPVPAMADDTHRVLWCIIKGNSTPFPIAVPGNATIGEVKNIVWEKCKNELQKIDAAHIMLSKVSSEWLADGYQLTPYS